MTTAVLLIAHGSRRAEANADLVSLAETLLKHTDFEIIEPSYLEIASPSISEGAARCVDRGASEVLMLPYFLSAGSHVRSDLERFRQECSAAHPPVVFRLCPPLGLHPLMIEIVKARLLEADG